MLSTCMIRHASRIICSLRHINLIECKFKSFVNLMLLYLVFIDSLQASCFMPAAVDDLSVSLELFLDRLCHCFVANVT